MSLPPAKELWTQFPRKSYWDRINPLASHVIDHSADASTEPQLPVLKTNRELVLETLTRDERLQIYALEEQHGVKSPRLQIDITSSSSTKSESKPGPVNTSLQQEVEDEEEDTISSLTHTRNATRSASSAVNLHTTSRQLSSIDTTLDDESLEARPVFQLQTASTGDLLRAGPRPRPQVGERRARPRGIIYETVPSGLHKYSEEKLNKRIAEGWESSSAEDEHDEDTQPSESDRGPLSSGGMASMGRSLPYTISDPFDVGSTPSSANAPINPPSGKRNRFMERILGQSNTAVDAENPQSSLLSRDMFSFGRRHKKDSASESTPKQSHKAGKQSKPPTDFSHDGAADANFDVAWPAGNISDTMSSLRGGFVADEHVPYMPLEDLEEAPSNKDTTSPSHLQSGPRFPKTNRPDSWYVYNGADMADLLAQGATEEEDMPSTTRNVLDEHSTSEQRRDKHRDSAWETEYSGDAQAGETESTKLARYHREVDGMFESLARRRAQDRVASSQRPRSSWLYGSDDGLTETSFDISQPLPPSKDTPSSSGMAILPGPQRSPTLRKNTGTDSFRARDGLEMQRSMDEDVTITYGAPDASSSSLGSRHAASAGKERRPFLRSWRALSNPTKQSTSDVAPPRSRTENDLGMPSANFSRIVEEAEEWRTRVPHSPTPSALPAISRRHSLGAGYSMRHSTTEGQQPKRLGVFGKLRRFVSRRWRAPSKATQPQSSQRVQSVARSSKLLVHGCDWQSEMALVEQLQEEERRASRAYALMTRMMRQSSFWSVDAVRGGGSSGMGSEVEAGDSLFGERRRRFSCLY